MTALRTYSWTGKLRALQPLAHGGKNSGTVHAFRRETIFGADGNPIHAVPSISGGTIRYSLREIAAKIMHHFLVGDGTLPFASVHAMLNGGAMKETKSVSELITGEKQAILRETLPLFAVFGGMGGARSISGRLVVESALPIAEETAFLAPYYLVEPPEKMLSVYELVSRQPYGRFSSAEGTSAQSLITQDSDRTLPKGGGMLFWSQEVLPRGVELFHGLKLTDATPIEASFFAEVYALWAKSAFIGQQKRVGMGKVVPVYTEEVTNIAGIPDTPIECNWREELKDRKDEALEALTWL